MNVAVGGGGDRAEALRGGGTGSSATEIATASASAVAAWPGHGRESQSVADRFARIVAAGPERPALRTPEGCISYAELDRESDRIVAALADDAPGAGRPVAILMDMSPGFVFALLGALKAGRCYVPLSTDAPPESNRQIMDAAEAGVLLVEGQYLAQGSALAAETCRVVDVDALPHSATLNRDRAAVSPDAIAYIIYTSGSSGLPKGVYQNQRNLVHYARLQAEVMALSPDDGIACTSPPGVFGTVNSVFSALLNGAALYLINVAKVGFPQLRASLQAGQVTVFSPYVTLFRRFAATLDGSEDFAAVRLLRLVGEATTAGDFARYRSIFGPHCRLMVSYGSTEAMAVCARYYDAQTTTEDATLSPGPPMPGVELAILDEHGRPLPAGETGEIAVTSDYLSLGYWKRPELSRAAFLERGGRRTFRTGDLGAIRPDGSLEHRGRCDLQVKIRGFRVEIPEVELALERVADITESCVVGSRDANQETELLAWYVPADGLAAPGLRGRLGESLPAHMVPARVFALREMPRTASGKPDRALLGDPAFSDSALFRKLVLAEARIADPATVEDATPAPRPLAGTSELAVADVWKRVLKLPDIEAGSRFFMLGGTSLDAMEMQSEIEKIFEAPADIDFLFEDPTLAELAARMSSASG